MCPCQGQLRTNTEALRRLLGDGTLAEYLRAPPGPVLAAGRLRANSSVLWRHFTNAVYGSGDLPVIAVREALQNAVDAIKRARRAHQIGAEQGRFDVVWDEESRELSLGDNGYGMDGQTVWDKFLSLGDSGKRDSDGSDDQAGGFGVAKAVILGVSRTYRWELWTRDKMFLSQGPDHDIEMFDAPQARQGTLLTLHDISTDFDLRRDYVLNERVPLLDRLHEVLGANDLDQITLTLNGREVPRLFNRRAGSRIQDDAPWGRGTTAWVKGYRRPAGDRQGGFWIRLNGLFQYKERANNGLGADIVIDLHTTLRPGEDGYPLNIPRTGLQAGAAEAYYYLKRDTEREDGAAGTIEDDEVFEADSTLIAPQTKSALSDPALLKSLSQVAGSFETYYEHLGSTGDNLAVGSSAPATSAEKPAMPQTFVPPAGLAVAEALGAVDPATPQAAVSAVRFYLDHGADTTVPPGEPSSQDEPSSDGMTSPPSRLTGEVQSALSSAAAGTLTSGEAQTLETAIEEVASRATGPGGGGLIVAMAAPRVYQALDRLAPDTAAERQAHRKSPFGALGALRISKSNYDKKRANKFKKQWDRHVPKLIVWDATLRLIATQGRIRIPFGSGFLLDNASIAKVAKDPSGRFTVYLNPDRLDEIIEAHRSRPMSIAYFLHSCACHELAHLDGRMGENHSESFVQAREALGEATCQLLIPITQLVTTTLSLPPDRMLCAGPTAAQIAQVVLPRLYNRITSPPKGVPAAKVQAFLRQHRRSQLKFYLGLFSPPK